MASDLYAVHEGAEQHEQAGPRNLIPDAALATLAIEHGVSLASTDTDFARFRGLRWENPLA